MMYDTTMKRIFAVAIIMAVIAVGVLAAYVGSLESQGQYRVLMLSCPGGPTNLMAESWPAFGDVAAAQAHGDAQLAAGYDIAYVYDASNIAAPRLIWVKSDGCLGNTWLNWRAP